MLVAGFHPLRADALDAVHHGNALRLALHGVAAVEVQQLPVPEGQIQAAGGRLLQPQGGGAGVFDPQGPGDEVPALVHAVEKLRLQPQGLVSQGDGEGLRLPVRIEGRGETAEGVLAPPDLVAHIAQLRPMAALRRPGREGREAEIAAVGAAELLGQGVQHVLLEMQRGEVSLRPAAVVGMQQMPQGAYLHLIAALPGVQGQRPDSLIIDDTHNDDSFAVR